jgi:hypothetical protein
MPHQAVQHIIDMPLHDIIIGMPACIILSISWQQLANISAFMPCIGCRRQVIAPFFISHSIAHIMCVIAGIIIGIVAPGIMHSMLMLPQLIVIGMPALSISAIMSQQLANMVRSMPCAGDMTHIIAPSVIVIDIVAIVIGMPIIGIMPGMAAFIGMVMFIAFIGASSFDSGYMERTTSTERILGNASGGSIAPASAPEAATDEPSATAPGSSPCEIERKS